MGNQNIQPITVDDLISEIKAEYAYFRTTTVKQHKRNSLRRLDIDVRMLMDHVKDLEKDI